MRKKLVVYIGVVLGLFVAISVSSALVGYVAHKESWPAKIHAYLAGRTDPCCIEQVQERLTPSDPQDQFSQVDAVRDFVFTNSIRADHDFEQDIHPYDTGGVIQALIDANDGQIGPISLLCSSRSNAMTGILDQMGLRSRQVHVFSEQNGSHTFLEVNNTQDGKWYIQDPDYDLFWVETATKRRLGLGEMLTMSLDDVAPCKSTEDCGWHLAENLRPYFGAGIYFNFDATPLIVVNQDRFNLNTVLEYNDPPGTIVEFADVTWGADYGKPILSVVHGEP